MSSTDPVVYIAVSAALTLLIVAACLIPARQAMRTDPIEVLRSDWSADTAPKFVDLTDTLNSFGKFMATGH